MRLSVIMNELTIREKCVTIKKKDKSVTTVTKNDKPNSALCPINAFRALTHKSENSMVYVYLPYEAKIFWLLFAVGF